MTDAFVDKIRFGSVDISDASPEYTCKVIALVRYGEFDWTEVTFLVQLPKKDYKISEFKAATIAKVKDAVDLIARHHDFAEAPGEGF